MERLSSNRRMKLREIIELLDAEVLTRNADLEREVEYAGASDLMSDVLAFTRPGSVLLTGLQSIQVVRTAEMLDLKAIVFVRGKRPDANTIALAEEMGLPLFVSSYPLYEACGILYQAGLPGSLGTAEAHGWNDLMNNRAVKTAEGALE
ncbi:MAG: DRTGG domain-containing protein [Armatimonadota bacterium]